MNNAFNSELIKVLVYETPFFLFSKEKILQKFKEFQQYFPNTEIHYAMKANSEFQVLQTLEIRS